MLTTFARAAVQRATAPSRAAVAATGRRGAAGGAHGGHDPHAVTYEGVTLHKPKFWHTAWAQGMAGLMW